MTTMLALATCERMPYRTADTREMLLVHRALLRYVNYFASVAPSIDQADATALDIAENVAAELVAAARALATTQGEILWPTLLGYLEAAGSPTEALEVVAARHADIDRRCTDVLVAMGSPRFPAAMQALADTLAERLGEVERVALPAAEAYMTERQWNDLVDRFVADLASGDRGLLMLGGLLHEGSRRERARIARGARGGRLAAFAYRRGFDKRFAAVQAVLGPER